VLDVIARTEDDTDTASYEAEAEAEAEVIRAGGAGAGGSGAGGVLVTGEAFSRCWRCRWPVVSQMRKGG
jgi:hypothetical protein